MTTKRKRKRSAARPAAPDHGFVVEQQPDDITCGPACLHGVYRHYGDDDLPLDRIIADIHTLDQGGTLDVFLANHALQRGYAATILTYNLDVFDPTWFALPNDAIRERLAAQASVKSWSRLQTATRGYDEFLRLGGKLLLLDLDPKLLRHYLDRGPIIAGLSATYLYRAVRDIPETNADDDVRGEPVGHFVVLTGHRRNAREILIADPLKTNPLVQTRYYAVQVQRLIGAILLGVMTYDANLLVIEPKRVRQ